MYVRTLLVASLLVCFVFLMIRLPPRSTRTDTLFPTRRSSDLLAPPSLPAPRPVAAGPARERRRAGPAGACGGERSEEHTSELQSLMRISYAVFCLKKKN